MRAVRAAALAAVLVLVAGCGGTEITPPRASSDDGAVEDSAASDLLVSLARAVADDDPAGASQLAPSGGEAPGLLSAAVRNAATLGLRDVGFRYVSRSAPDEGDGAQADPADGSTGRTWDATVTVTWRLPEYDDTTTTVPARFTFTGEGSDVRLVDTAAPGERSALWLSGPLSVARTPDALVMAARGTRSGSVATLRARAVRAVSDVREVLPGWRGPLVVEAPGSESDLERLIGAARGSYAAIAAVTTTVDGSKTPRTPVHVYLNPAVFGALGSRGSQVVLSHEATHVATGASFADLPTWLLEGFADYVALDHAGIAFTTAASQVLRRVREDGAPTSLPDASDLSPSATGLGATYEEAWTACRFLAGRYGERALVDFYDAVSDGTPPAQAFTRVLGTSQRAFERAWSRDLAASARAS